MMARTAGRLGLILAVAGATSACANMTRQEQSALSLGAGGAALGAMAGAVFGPAILTGALLGGAAGAAVGALKER